MPQPTPTPVISHIVYNPIACSNRLLYVAQSLQNRQDDKIDCYLLAKSILEVEGRLMSLPYPSTVATLPILKQCLINLECVNRSLYAIERSQSLHPCPSFFIDYVYHALLSEIQLIEKRV